VAGNGAGQKERIADLALKLMAERGAEGMSMRDLAAAAEVNVATIYHYFPSKRDLLTAILESRGYIATMEDPRPVPAGESPAESLAALLEDSWQSMVAVEDYIRLMLGEALRSDTAAQSVGEELLVSVEAALGRWIQQIVPSVEAGTAPLARTLRAVLIGVFIEHLTGATDDPAESLRRRAAEVAGVLAAVLEPGAPGSGRT
jgi:AcrR family transcriptional regulator